MAVDYDKLFKSIGEYLERIVFFESLLPQMDAAYSEIESELTQLDMPHVLEGTFTNLTDFKRQILGWIDFCREKIQSILTDRELVLQNLPLEGTGIEEVLTSLIRDMRLNNQTVLKNTVNIGTIQRTVNNPSSGNLLVTSVLDGASPPGGGATAVPDYFQVPSELAENEVIRLECIRDSFAGDAQPDAETFAILGGQPPTHPFSWETPGSGNGPDIRPAQGSNLVPATAMEDFEEEVPVGWTVVQGIPGITIRQESNPSRVFKGLNALWLRGNSGSSNRPVLKVFIPPGTFQPRKRYLFCVYVLGSPATAAGTLTIQFEGTGYVPLPSEKIVLTASQIAGITSWELFHFFFGWPEVPPVDMALTISFTGTSPVHEVLLDDGAVAEVTYHGGAGFVLIAGKEPFVQGDLFSVPLQNNNQGIFQTFFRKAFRVQLPSSSSPSQPDSRATD